MAFDKAAFREQFPEFADEAEYSDAVLDIWLVAADLFVSSVKWGEYYVLGMSLVLAHNLVLANTGQADPGTGGSVASEAAGSINVTYDVLSTIEERGGQWNLTTYGKRYLRIARMIGGCAAYV